MEKNNFMKLVWLVCFVLFGAVSCWATTESLHMLLSSWPKAACWVISIGFFIIAAVGTKMIVDSFNKNAYIEHRGWRLMGGVVIMLLFWLVCSMPTNTHTFFYRNVISDRVNGDISATRGYLGQIKSNSNNEKQARLKVQELKNKVDSKLIELEAEIQNDANPGFGPNAKKILRSFAELLSVDRVDPISYRSTSKKDRDKLCDLYRTKIYAMADTRAQNMVTNILKPNADNLKEVKAADNNLATMTGYIDQKSINLNSAQDMNGANGVCSHLNDGYNAVKKNADFVNFDSEEDAQAYTSPTPVTKVKRMMSVFDVWEDFMAGKYAGHGFTFWIIISVLIDIAAFVFFDLAFPAKEY